MPAVNSPQNVIISVEEEVHKIKVPKNAQLDPINHEQEIKKLN